MVEVQWEGIRDEELRYQDHTWELTGEVDVRQTGERLRARARRADGVRRETGSLLFGLADGGGSLNPGALGGAVARLEREDGRYFLVVEEERRAYRYELHSLEYE